MLQWDIDMEQYLETLLYVFGIAYILFIWLYIDLNWYVLSLNYKKWCIIHQNVKEPQMTYMTAINMHYRAMLALIPFVNFYVYFSDYHCYKRNKFIGDHYTILQRVERHGKGINAAIIKVAQWRLS